MKSWVGSREVFQQKEAPERFDQNYKFTLGSILTVDSWHREIHKNDEIISKKIKILGEECIPKIDYENDYFERLSSKDEN